MNDTPKPWYTSKTVWGSIIAIAMPIINQICLRFHLTAPDDQSLIDYATTVGSAIAGGIAIYGRMYATAPVGKTAS